MNLNNRLQELENRISPKEKKSAWVAMIDVNEKVTLSHAKNDTVYLNSRKELHNFIIENDLQDMQVLIVDVVNTKGEPPKEL